jgi:[protein-PII] uridylyltransferase
MRETPLFRPGRNAIAELAERTASVEREVCSAAARFLAPALGDGWAALAVGGFGRGDLFPYSDVDLLLLVDRTQLAAANKDAIHAFLRTLWDAGLSPSHSVRTVDECCRLDVNNVELTISLLTKRFLAGSAALEARLSEKLPVFIASQKRAVLDHLLRLTANRHAKFQSTIYHLEPDVKETPGGFRDLHLIEWLGLLRGAAPPETESLDPARAFLANVRTCLHERARRNDNRLTFDAQDELFENPAASMRDHYRHARAVFRAAQNAVAAASEPGPGMLRSFLDWRSRLSNSEFTVSNDRVFLRTPQALAADASLAMRLLQFVARHGVVLSRDTERRLTEAVQGGLELSPLQLWREWRDLMSLPHAARAVRTMYETGLLKKLLPAWERIECLVSRDFYHRYTVDEHTIVTLERLEELAASKDDSQRPFRDLLTETSGVHMLRTALLLHDIGKGGGTGEHEAESARLSEQALERLGAPPAEREMILWLVRHHLDLSLLMTSRDLHDAEAVDAAAHRIGTLERLQLLTLMTFCDIGAVNPSALTPWRMAQLWSAYRSLHQELTRELEADRIEAPAAGNPERDEFLRGLPTRYLMVNTEADIVRHLSLVRQARTAGAAVELEREEGHWRATVVTADRPGLLADLAGMLAGFGMNILKAEAFSNSSGVVLDVFHFSDPARRLEFNPEEAADLARLLTRVSQGRENVQRHLSARPKPMTPGKRNRIAPIVSFDPRVSRRATLLEVIAEDRPGLLYDVAHLIAAEGCNIEVLLINTEAHKAIDVFYLTCDGAPLDASRQGSLRRQLQAVLS